MTTSAQSAVSASARLSVDGSEGDREPARDNVFPSDMNNYRSPSASAERLHCDTCTVHRHQLPLDDCLGLACAITHIDPPAVEPPVLEVTAQRPLRAGRRDLQVIWTFDEVGVIDQWPDDAAQAFAIIDGDRLDAVDEDSEAASRVT